MQGREKKKKKEKSFCNNRRKVKERKRRKARKWTVTNPPSASIRDVGNSAGTPQARQDQEPVKRGNPRTHHAYPGSPPPQNPQQFCVNLGHV